MNKKMYSHNRPRRLRAKYTHRTNLTIYGLCISPRGAAPPGAGDKENGGEKEYESKLYTT